MIAYLAGLELRSRFRARGVLTLGVFLVALLGISTWIGVQRVQTFEAERAAASAADRWIWVEQGADNPHSAAHFSRYAFKPVPILGLFDPGALGPNCGTVRLVMQAENTPKKSDTRVVDPGVLRQIWEDFAPYRALEK